MDDTRQELYQRSLRNVRAYLDKEEAEAEREKRGTRRMLVAFIVVIVLAVVAVVIWAESRRAMQAAEAKSLNCVARAWAAKSAARERELRAENPAITPREVGTRLQAENAALEAAATRECRAAK